ncbi:DUF2023 family protein [Dysgonomonas sp. 25]|uniref:DUF2023 family protein n=1 Tax=Dysgonomonas sp. 25 TaxID=2302933 RepID=UPI0013D1853A|nr:DUF2023 family protein [Dysgonomonas sp. 25]NDV70356.1 DUF2023 family protein [Dysgonomonas sp. 25]
MSVFHHLIYEYRKGVRDMILCTLPGHMEDEARKRLERNAIGYIVQKQPNGNINIFFGKEECLKVINSICKDKPLNKLTPEEDFILGILLGYSIKEQCTRFCKKQRQGIRIS